MNENAQRWVEALRSGDYQQGQYVLRQPVAGDADVYCCLGVACELYIEAGGTDLTRELGMGEGRSHHNKSVYVYKSDNLRGQAAGGTSHDRTATLPTVVVQWLGLSNASGGWDVWDGEFESHGLTGMNDGGASFDQIADLIEQEPRGLFV